MTAPSDPGLRLIFETALANHGKCMASTAAPFKAYQAGYKSTSLAPRSAVARAYWAAGAEQARRRWLAAFRSPPSTGGASPVASDWLTANALFSHPRGCDCSTCALAAKLAVALRERGAYA